MSSQGDSLERFIESPLLLSAQGLALTPDERSLFVADYARGILRVDLRRRSVTLVEAADGVLALGIDGLYLHHGSLVGIQNGTVPHRVARFTLSSTGAGYCARRCWSGPIPGTMSPPWALRWMVPCTTSPTASGSGSARTAGSPIPNPSGPRRYCACDFDTSSRRN